jgi:hypothetical protein
MNHETKRYLAVLAATIAAGFLWQQHIPPDTPWWFWVEMTAWGAGLVFIGWTIGSSRKGNR